MNCRPRNAFAARIMMTRSFEAATCSPPKSCVGGNCLVPSGARKASGNPRLRRQGQACGGRAIGHPDRRRHRSPEKSPLSGAHGNGVRRSGIGHRRYSLCRVVPSTREKSDHSHDLARSATRKALIRNRDFQNELVAPASRRQFLYSRRVAKLPAGRRRYQTCDILREISMLVRSVRRNGRS